MKNWLTPLILVIIAVFLFFGFIDPTYSEVKVLQEEISQFDQALERSKELQKIRDELLSKYNTFATSDIDRLEKLLPDNVDNVRLILDIDGIAQNYAMSLANVSITEKADRQEDAVGVVGPDNSIYGSVQITFEVSGSYEDFTDFIADLEDSLRLVDIISISFAASEASSGFNQYEVTVKTYWLK